MLENWWQIYAINEHTFERRKKNNNLTQTRDDWYNYNRPFTKYRLIEASNI